MRREPSARQLEILRLLGAPVLRYEPPRTCDEIGEALEISGPAVRMHLIELAGMGLVESKGKARGYYPTKAGREVIQWETEAAAAHQNGGRTL